MSEPKFTKEPWNSVKRQDYDNLGLTEYYYDVYHIINAKGEIIAKLTAEGMGKDKNIKANADLMTAAPDMYALLLDIVTDYQCMPNPAVMADKIEAVLKKARGEE